MFFIVFSLAKWVVCFIALRLKGRFTPSRAPHAACKSCQFLEGRPWQCSTFTPVIYTDWYCLTPIHLFSYLSNGIVTFNTRKKKIFHFNSALLCPLIWSFFFFSPRCFNINWQPCSVYWARGVQTATPTVSTRRQSHSNYPRPRFSETFSSPLRFFFFLPNLPHSAIRQRRLSLSFFPFSLG